MKRAPRDPIIPGSTRDRTGAGGILKRAGAQIRRRFDGLKREVLGIFGAIRFYELNEVAQATDYVRVAYAMTPDELAATAEALQRALDRWIAAGRDTRHVLWWEPLQADAARLGTAQAHANLAQLSEAYAAARSLEQIIFSEAYANRIGMAQVKSYEHWSGLSQSMRQELSQIIGRAVADGKNPRAVRREIAERLDVSMSKALQYAQTDITDTLRQARWAEDDAASEELGLQLAELWTSALIPTTRPTHAARNGRVYSTAEVRAFYDRDGNRYNCFLPDTPVSGRFVAGIKSRYKGPALSLVTAGGRKLSVTTNHPVLTARGMVPAAEVRKGDQLVAYGAEHEGSLRVGDLNGGLAGARAEDAFGALVNAGHQFAARVSAVDLHGDAKFCKPDVEVVRAHRELVLALDATAAQLLDQLSLVLADAPAAAGGFLRSLFGAGGAAPRGGMSSGSIGRTLFGRHAAHAQQLGFVPAPDLNSVQGEPAGEDSALKATGLAEGQHGFAGLVSLDEVVEVRNFDFDGHVYDFQEQSGLMLGSNIVVSNCRCAQTTCLIGDDGKPILSPGLRAAMAKEKAAWQKAHAAAS